MSITGSAETRVIAYGVPAVLIAFGGFLLLSGYTMEKSNMIGAGWILLVTGALCYIFEIVAKVVMAHYRK